VFLGCVRSIAKHEGVEPKTLQIKKRSNPTSPLSQHADATLDTIEACRRSITERANRYLYRNGGLGMSAQEKEQSDLGISATLRAVDKATADLEKAVAELFGETSDQMKHHHGQVQAVKLMALDVVKLFWEQKSFRRQQAERIKKPRASPELTATQDFADGSVQVASREGAEDGEPKQGQQLLEEENAALLREMQCLNAQVHDIQGKMIEIGELSSLFRTEIIQQSATIDQIFELTEQSSHNMVKGNESMEQANKDGFSFRLMMVVFLLVASVCVLFLDWYQ